MANILIIAGDFVEDYELMVPFQALRTVSLSFAPIKWRDKLLKRQFMTLKATKPIPKNRATCLRLMAILQALTRAILMHCCFPVVGRLSIYA